MKLVTKFAPASVVVAFLFAFLFGYWSVLLLQQEGPPEGGATIQVRANPDDVDVLGGLTALAEKHGERVSVMLPQPSHTDVYATGAVGERTYRMLPPAQGVVMHDFSELPFGETRWTYTLSPGREFAADVEAYLADNNVTAQRFQGQKIAFLFAGTPLGSMTLLVLAICSAAIIAATLLRSKDYAIWQLHGLGFWRSSVKEFNRSFRNVVLVSAGVVLVATAGIGAVISPRVGVIMAQFTVAFAALFCVAMAVSFLLSLALVRRMALPARLKGKLPVLSTGLLALVMQSAAVISIASFAIPALNYAPEYSAQRAQAENWERMSDVIVARLSGARDLDGMDEAQRQLASVIRDMSAKGDVVYAEYRDENMGLAAGVDAPGISLNQTGADRSVSPPLPPAEHPVLYLPAGLNFSNELAAESMGCAQGCEIRPLPAGHEVFTWDIEPGGFAERAVVRDPMIMVFPNAALPESDRTLVAAMSQFELGFTSTEFFDRVEENPEISSFVIGTSTMAGEWALAKNQLGRDTVMFVGGLLAAIAFCLATAIVVALIYRRLWQQRLFVNYAFGRYPVAVYIRMAGIGVLSLAAVSVYFWHRGGLLRELAQAPPGAASPAFIAQFSVSPAAIALTLVAAVVAFSVSVATVTLPGKDSHGTHCASA